MKNSSRLLNIGLALAGVIVALLFSACAPYIRTSTTTNHVLSKAVQDRYGAEMDRVGLTKIAYPYDDFFGYYNVVAATDIGKIEVASVPHRSDLFPFVLKKGSHGWVVSVSLDQTMVSSGEAMAQLDGYITTSIAKAAESRSRFDTWKKANAK